MELSQILAKCDHTLLAQTATWEDIKKLCDDAMAYRTASVCIPPFYVKQVADYVTDPVLEDGVFNALRHFHLI